MLSWFSGPGRAWLGAALIGGAVAGSVACAPPALAASEPETKGGEAVVRRLTPNEYRQIIEDVFGKDIRLGGRFETATREAGLLAVGAGRASVSPTGIEQIDAMAQTVADQVVDPNHRGVFIPCQPKSETQPDDGCSAQFLSKAGRLLFRRPLTEKELQERVSAAADSAKNLKSFYAGLSLSLASLLESPEFLFRQDKVAAGSGGSYRLDGFSKASRLSFLLWDAAPDDELLTAAQSGSLDTQKGLEREVDRLMASPRVESGVRAFFSDMLQFDLFQSLAKDNAIYPNFGPDVARDAQEQTLRTIVDHLLVKRGDYRDLFTTRATFLTPLLGSIYGVPITKDTPNGAPENWVPYEYPANDQRAGLLSQLSFVALHSHPGRSSPTLRGKALREVLLCQKVPDPPGNVNFTVVQDTKNPQYRTARDRVTAHRTDPTCAGCHKLIDPMGLALENFDSDGSYRASENGAVIDTSGELDGVKFTGAAGLGKAMHDNPMTSSCVVNRAWSYALGRPAAKGEAAFVKYLEAEFAANGYRVPDLLRKIATSDAFYRVEAPQTGAVDVPATKLAGRTFLEGGK